MRHLFILSLAALTATPAFAAPVTIADATDDIAYSSDSGQPTGYFGSSSRGDYIGADFNTNSITVNRTAVTGGTLFDFQLSTQFDGHETIGAYTVNYADLFLRTPSTGTPAGTFNYAVVLGDQTSNGGLATAGLYATPTYETSSQIWNGRSGYTYGGEFVQSGASAGTAAPIATVATGGSWLSDAAVTRSGNAASGYIEDVSFVLSPGQAAAFANGFDVLWGTGDCGNDAVFGTVGPAAVPEPGTLALVASGAVGMVALRRARTRA